MTDDRQSTGFRKGVGAFAGEFLLVGALWALGGIGFVVATWLVASATDSPVAFAPLIAVLVLLVGWGTVLTIQYRPGLYLEDLTEERRAALGTGWSRRVRLAAMVSVQVAALAVVGYMSWRLTFG